MFNAMLAASGEVKSKQMTTSRSPYSDSEDNYLIVLDFYIIPLE